MGQVTCVQALMASDKELVPSDIVTNDLVI